MHKDTILATIVAELEQEVATLTAAAQTSFNDATDEESRAESKYDTRSLETSYLASGQARLAVEAREALSRFKNLNMKSFKQEDAIALSAFIEVRTDRETNYYFLGPSSGGLEIRQSDKTIMVITPQSPIGSRLLGKKQGDTVTVTLGRNQERLTIVDVK